MRILRPLPVTGVEGEKECLNEQHSWRLYTDILTVGAGSNHSVFISSSVLWAY